ncbi:MAG: cobalamin-dependent protein [Pseudomonadota bacterium]
MTEGPKQGRASDGTRQMAPVRSGRPGAPGTVEAFATQVLSLVAANSQATRGALRQDLLTDLIEAVLGPDQTAVAAMPAHFAAAGIDAACVLDRYLPAAARRLGVAWCEDEMSFADVTIGSARLQALLRDLRAPQVTDPRALSVLVVSPEDAYHTLGAGVVADQLRRLGVAPRLAIGLPNSAVADLAEAHDFNAVMVSAAASQRLETLRELVNCIRTALSTRAPIIIGGSVTDKDTDIRTLTGADYVSNNPEEALRSCGLMIPTPAAAPLGPKV